MNSARLYRALLAVLPGRFRERYGAEMVQMFVDEWTAASNAHRAVLVVRTIRDLTWTAIAARFDPSPANERGRLRPAQTQGLGLDIRAAVRALRARPGYTATAIVTLALGIGATTAVFSVVQASVLKALPIPQLGKVTTLWTGFTNNPGPEFLLSAAEANDVLQDVRSLGRAGAWFVSRTALDARDGLDARTLTVANTVGDVYSVIGARVILGRLPAADENRLGVEPMALLSHRFWQENFGGSNAVIEGGVVPIGSGLIRVIGVLSPEVMLPGARADVWIHRVLDPATWSANRSGHGYLMIGRLRPEATLEQLKGEVGALQRRWAERYAGQHTLDGQTHVLHASLLGDRVLGGARRVGVLLSVAAVLLLILAVANVANLLLARGERRHGEIGVRLALGASRRHVTRLVLTESVLLSVVGGVVGLMLAIAGVPLLLRLAPADIAQTAAGRLSPSIVAFALASSLLAGVLATLVPSWVATRHDPLLLLRASGRGRTQTSRSLNVLVGCQIAVATALLCAAGVLARSMQTLNAVAPGLATDGRVTLTVRLPNGGYPDGARIAAFYEQARPLLEALPGIERVSVLSTLPLRDAPRREGVRREGAVGTNDAVPVLVQVASAAVLKTLGARLIEGRDLALTDRDEGERVALVNRSAATALWPGQSAVGQRLTATFTRPDSGSLTVVGVYEDVHSVDLVTPTTPEIVLPMEQLPGMAGLFRTATLVAHVTVAPEAAIATLRESLRRINVNIAIVAQATMRDVLRNSTARERFLSTLIGVFAVLAAVIAAVGVFGLVTFAVARRSREFAIRSALGATPQSLLASAVGSHTGIAAAGALAGAGLAWLVAPLLHDYVFQISPRDIAVFTAVPVMLIGVSVLSSLVPALRITRTSATVGLEEGE